MDFTDFFEQWYFGEGYPTYSIEWEQIESDLTLQINHTSSKPNVTPTFTSDLDVRFQRIALPDTTVRFSISSNNEVFSINDIGSISGVINIDPENWIINKVGSITGNDITGLDSVSEREKIYFSPNPSDGVFYIENLNSPAHIIVRDMNGKIRKQKDVFPGEFINIKELGKGSYLIELQLNEYAKILKLITF